MNNNIVQNGGAAMDQPQYMQSRNSSEYEISLLDLWKILVVRKKIIFLCTTLATVGALIYALISPPIYKAEIFFLPPAMNDVQSLNIQNIQNIQNIHYVDALTVYSLYKQKLGSRSAQKDFSNTYKDLVEGKGILGSFKINARLNYP